MQKLKNFAKNSFILSQKLILYFVNRISVNFCKKNLKFFEEKKILNLEKDLTFKRKQNFE